MNPVSYFEIPVNDLKRATRFYGAVFKCEFELAHVDGNDMAFFPHMESVHGASGALAKGDSYVPGKSGVRIYFDVADIQETLKKAVEAGCKILYPETAVGTFGFVAEIEDLEGNCIGLHSVSRPSQPEG